MIVDKQYYVYAAGPIAGCSWEECTKWRNDLRYMFPTNITVISPLRAKKYLNQEKSVALDYKEFPLSTQRGIVTRDKFDVARCDLVFVNLLNAKTVSIGTCFEIAWAHLLNKPIIVVMEDRAIHQHPFIKECSNFIFNDLEEAVKVATAILLPEIP